MSALHTLPSAAAVAATTTTTAAATPVEPAAGDISFAAVLSAQLGFSSTAAFSVLGSSSAEPAAEDKALPDTIPGAAADAANALSLIPLAVPVTVQAPVAAVEDNDHATSRSDKPALLGKMLLPSAETLRNTFLPEQPVLESAAGESAQTPANSAAALQGLPAASQDRHEHALAAGDTSSAGLSAATLAVASEAQSTHRAPLATAVPVPVQDARWSNAFSERVVWITGQQVQTAEIHIEPPQLGPIEVRISITNDQANLLFNAPHAVARDAIQMSLPRLQEMLIESGLTLGNVSVGAHNAGGQHARDDADRGGNRSGSDPVAGVDPLGPQTALRIQRGAGLVDLFA